MYIIYYLNSGIFYKYNTNMFFGNLIKLNNDLVINYSGSIDNDYDDYEIYDMTETKYYSQNNRDTIFQKTNDIFIYFH